VYCEFDSESAVIDSLKSGYDVKDLGTETASGGVSLKKYRLETQVEGGLGRNAAAEGGETFVLLVGAVGSPPRLVVYGKGPIGQQGEVLSALRAVIESAGAPEAVVRPTPTPEASEEPVATPTPEAAPTGPVLVRIESDPEGAKVRCKDHPNESGTTPFEKKLPPGTHDFELSKSPGYEPTPLELEVAAPGPVEEKVSLVARIDVETQPEGAVVACKTHPQEKGGKAPLTLALRGSGPHELEFKLDGTPVGKTSFVPGSVEVLKVTLPIGIALIQTEPSGATLVCKAPGHEKEKGTGSKPWKLRLGEHQVTVTAKGYGSEKVTFEISKESPRFEGRVSLKTEVAAVQATPSPAPEPTVAVRVIIADGGKINCASHPGELIRGGIANVRPGDHNLEICGDERTYCLTETRTVAAGEIGARWELVLRRPPVAR
jgi:hypothetical protein